MALVWKQHSFAALQPLSCRWSSWRRCWPGWQAAQGWRPTPAPPISSSPPSPEFAFGGLDSDAGCTLGEAGQLPGGGTGSRRRDTPETSHSIFHLLSHLVDAEPLVVGFSPAGVVVPLPLSPTQLALSPTLQSPIRTAVAHHLTLNLTPTPEVARRIQTKVGWVALVRLVVCPQQSPPHNCRQLWQTRRVQRRLQDTSSLR